MMKFNFLLLSAAALFNGATALDPVDLGTAGNYAVLTSTGISTVPASSITGDIAVSPIAATAITGFGLSQVTGEDWSTCTQVTGKAYAPGYSLAVKTTLITAVGDMVTAYGDAFGRPAYDDVDQGQTYNELKEGDISGETLTPGVYTFTTDISINDDITLDGTSTDVFIIRTTGSLLQATSKNVNLTGGVDPKNVFWQVAGHVEVGASAVLNGILLVMTDALFKDASTLNGRVLAQTACNLKSATIVEPTSA
jgi:hypothetical protein